MKKSDMTREEYTKESRKMKFAERIVRYAMVGMAVSVILTAGCCALSNKNVTWVGTLTIGITEPNAFRAVRMPDGRDGVAPKWTTFIKEDYEVGIHKNGTLVVRKVPLRRTPLNRGPNPARPGPLQPVSQ